jgi:hypothetical protein
MTTDDTAGALARLDADLAAAAVTRELEALRRRVIGAYRSALVYAAGKPDDPHWSDFVRMVATFASRVPGTRSRRTAAALARLDALVAENSNAAR